MSFLFVNYPSWIHPEIFPSVPFLKIVRWYGLMYVFAFCTAYRVFLAERREGLLDEAGKTVSDDDVSSFFTAGIALLLVGARLGSTLIYDVSGYYWKNPLRIFWPFSEDGRFTGLVGMSYHGGYVGGFLGMAVWCAVKKRDFFKWFDAIGCAIPLGYTFGRLGNFFNGELFGRITTKPWGMVFPSAQKFSASLDWVRDFASRCGMQIAEKGLVNLPRHPSQLYEAFFEGIFLWAVCKIIRKKKPFDGFMIFVYTFGYGFVRFFIEYCREPDSELGFRTGDVSAATYMNSSLSNLSTGQIFCIGMMAFGLAALVFSWSRAKFANKSKKK